MQVHWQSPNQALPIPLTLAIGNFDGVHLGHQGVIARLLTIADAERLAPAVMSFFPHPREVITGRPPNLITTLRDRAFWLEHFGIQHWMLLSFTRRLQRCLPLDFVQHYLLARFQVGHILVGEDFRFGYRGAGDVDFLCQAGKQAGFRVSVLPAVGYGSESRVSSSTIRHALQQHRLADARALLGHDLTMTARVRHGSKRGREMTTPTANLHVPEHWCLPNGVYVVKARLLPDGEACWGVANLGVAPTFQDRLRKLEVHVFTPLGEVYGKFMRVEMKHFLRPERCFDSREALQAQIQQDIAASREYIAGAESNNHII